MVLKHSMRCANETGHSLVKFVGQERRGVLQLPVEVIVESFEPLYNRLLKQAPFGEQS